MTLRVSHGSSFEGPGTAELGDGRVVGVVVVDARATTMCDVDDGGGVRVRCGVRDVERVRNDDEDDDARL